MKQLLNIRSLLFISMAIALASCQKVIILDLNTAESTIVIEGNITTKQGMPQTVFVSTSGDFYTGDGLSFVGDATVVMKDENGQADTLIMQSPGIYYTLDLVPEENTEYTVEVYHQGEEYRGSEIFPVKKEIDSLWYVVNPGIFGDGLNEDGDTTYNIFVRFQDPLETEDFYRFVLSLNDSVVEAGFGTYLITDDELFNGQLFDLEIRGTNSIKGDTVTVDFQAIGEGTFKYYTGLNDALRSGGMGSTPYNPITNLSNDALGYFGAYTSDMQTIVIE